MPIAPALRSCTLALLGLLAGNAGAADVFRTVDATGRPIYTDRPATLPAERLKIANGSTDKAAAQQRNAAELERLNAAGSATLAGQQQSQATQKAAVVGAEDRAKRCTEARSRYEQYMISQAMFQTDPATKERRYLSEAEIGSAREQARKVVDEFCAD